MAHVLQVRSMMESRAFATNNCFHEKYQILSFRRSLKTLSFRRSLKTLSYPAKFWRTFWLTNNRFWKNCEILTNVLTDEQSFLQELLNFGERFGWRTTVFARITKFWRTFWLTNNRFCEDYEILANVLADEQSFLLGLRNFGERFGWRTTVFGRIAKFWRTFWLTNNRFCEDYEILANVLADEQPFLHQALGTKRLVPSAWYQALGTKRFVPSASYQVFGTKRLVDRKSVV